MSDASLTQSALAGGHGVMEFVLYTAQALAITGAYALAERMGGRRLRAIHLLLGVAVALLVASLLVAGTDGAGGKITPADQVDWLTRPALIEIPKGAEVTMPQESRAQSISVARSAYINHARIVDYVSESGERTRFSPSPEDIVERDTIVSLRAFVDVLNSLANRFWLKETVLILVAVLAGYLVGASALKVNRLG